MARPDEIRKWLDSVVGSEEEREIADSILGALQALDGLTKLYSQEHERLERAEAAIEDAIQGERSLQLACREHGDIEGASIHGHGVAVLSQAQAAMRAGGVS